jgi:putative membrane protein
MKTESNIPYSSFNLKELILRDFLAADRTILANERTFLAYIRTALTFFVTGVTFIRFFGHIVIEIVGYVFIPVSLLIFVIGLVRYRRMYHAISRLYQVGNDNNLQTDVVKPLNDRL